MGFFSKKESVDTSNSSGATSDSSSEDEMKGAPKAVLKLRNDVDSLNAQIFANSEMRKVSNERFAAIQETIGEMKNQLIEKDKTISKIQAKAEKAAGLVESVKPEQFMIELKRLDTKILALKGKIENTESIFNTVLEEMKGMRQKMSVFKGVEDIIKLNDDVKKELRGVQQVEARVTAHSDKVEGIFIEAQKKFNQFKDLDDKIKSVSENVKELSSQVNEDKGKLQTFAGKDNLLELKNEYESAFKKLDYLLKKKGIDISKVAVGEDIVDTDSKISDLTKKIEEQDVKLEQMMKMLEEFMGVSEKGDKK
ncbi:MAG: hypothetical protein WC755_02840 [Candidatus Woesearchaeota archaeon]|jgi:chromosome segregation ATPase